VDIATITDTVTGIGRALAPSTEPGALAAADADALLDLLLALERAARQLQGARYRVLSALDEHPAYRRNAIQDAASEVACALRISERAAQGQLADARTLTQVLPEALQQLAAGAVQTTQVRALIESTAGLGEQAARAVQARVLQRMPAQNPAATRKALSRAVLKADPDGAHRRHQHAREQRRVAHHPQGEGMSTLTAILPAEQAVHAMASIDAHARADRHNTPGDDRSLDQARADSLYHLLTGNPQAYPAALVHVSVPLDTLLSLDQEPGELEGYGPITAHTARALAAQADSLWQRLLTAPDAGLVVKTDPHRYRPTAEVRRQVSARDGHCTFPTCSMPAANSDLDHLVPFNHTRPEHGGATTPENLHALCRHHHRLKHQGGWTVHHSETSRDTTWTAPSGRQYAKTP
jgi:hypothetical protein